MAEEKNESLLEKEILNLSESDLWQSIGFHRPLAGYWYSLAFMIIQIVFVAAFTAMFFGYLYPFPESIGYRTAAIGIFMVFFQLFDLGTANIMDRFLGQSNISDPKKMISYIQYFIWYQMITGLIQVTTVAIYALYFVPKGHLAYAVWIMLIHSTTQYPGFLGVFRNTLNSLQQFNKTAFLNFISSEVFQRITEVALVIWGKYWGANNPKIGEIMGIAIGATIGLYLDDFIATLFSAFFFQKVMKKYDIRVRDCFIPEFGWEIVKECMTFGLKTGFPLILWPIVQLVSLQLWLKYVPQYTTFLALTTISYSIGSAVSTGINFGGAISEAYMNGKKELTRYYIAQGWRFIGFMQFFIISLILLLMLIIRPLFIYMNLEAYLLSTVFIIPKMVRDLQQPYNNLSEALLIGTNQPNISLIAHLYEDLMSLLSWYLIIIVWKLPQTYGLPMIAWLMPCGELFAIVTKVMMIYLYLHRKVIRITIPVWQTFIAPGISAFFTYLSGYTFYITAFPSMEAKWGTLTAIVIFILVGVFGGLFLYLALTVFFGAWDDGSVDSFRVATEMSGPGKLLTVPMFNVITAVVPKARLHNKFKMDNRDAVKEARELMILRMHNLKNL